VEPSKHIAKKDTGLGEWALSPVLSSCGILSRSVSEYLLIICYIPHQSRSIVEWRSGGKGEGGRTEERDLFSLFFVQAWILNPGPCACVAGAIPLVLCPQPSFTYFLGLTFLPGQVGGIIGISHHTRPSTLSKSKFFRFVFLCLSRSCFLASGLALRKW
jgi:hypothetical protein